MVRTGLLMGWQNRGFDQPHSSLREMVLPAESIAFPFALLTPPIFYIAGRYMGDARDRFRYVLGFCLGAGPFMFLNACIRWVVLVPWDGALQKYVSPTAHSPLDLIRQGFADQITMYIAIVAAAHAYQYFDKVRKQEVEKSEFQRALAASELETLKMQIHPHFLFNTLHGISTLVDTNQPGAKAMVLKLSSLLRSTLEHSSSDLIPLREELKIVRDYLDLEKMRLGARLKVDWLVGAGAEQTLIPQLILLPLVENAVRHGVACRRDGGWIEIKCERRASKLELSIRNSTGSKRTPGTGVGLKNTDARLRCLYADEATFAFVESPDHSATATIILPALGSGLGNATKSLVDDQVKKLRELMRVLVVDDEPLAQTALANFLAKRDDVEHFDTAGDAVEALQKLAENSYDVLLLDINMPELSGTQLVDQLREQAGPQPYIVFVTAHDEFAIAAFERHAVDYVLKPFSIERMGEALDRASRRAEGERATRIIEALPQLQQLSRARHSRIAIKANGRILFINPGDVFAVEAEGNYVLLQRNSGSCLLRESISAMAEKLDPYGFIRIHRSVLVNTSLVEEIKPYPTGEYGLRVKGGKEYTVTRTYRENLKSLAEFWIGAGTFLGD